MKAPRAKPFRLDDQIGFLLRRAYQRASDNLAARIARYDLTPPQFAVLARLNERGETAQNELGRAVAMAPANIRDVVLRLKARGILGTRRDSGDKRLVLVSLTRRGAALTRRMTALDVASTAATLAPLTPAEARALRRLLARVAGAEGGGGE